MPRTKLDRLNEKDKTPNHPVNTKPCKESAIGDDLAPAIVPSIPVNNIPVKGELKKLAGTPFLVDVDSGLVYLEPLILKAMKNS